MHSMSRRVVPGVFAALVGLAACSGGGNGGGENPTYSISGRVSGSIQGGVEIALAGTRTRAATTDANGEYRFTDLPDGSYTVTPAKSGFSFSPPSRAVSVTHADVIGSDFVATPAPGPTYAISGTVSGATRSGVVITLSGAATAETITDATGAYGFVGVENGSYAIAASKTGFVFVPSSYAVTVSEADVTGNDFTAIDLEWASWPIPDVAPGSAHYTVDLAGHTVIDQITGLVWQRAAGAGPSDWYDWGGAKSHCSALSLGGWSSGWRLPTLIELASLTDFSTYSPAINTDVFPSTPPDPYWTATPDASLVSYAWAVDLRNGETVVGPTSNNARARCVRNALNAPAASP